MSTAPKYMDPRRQDVDAYVRSAVERLEDHPLAPKIRTIVNSAQDVEALRKIHDLVNHGSGLSYDPEVLIQRARRRLETGLKVSRLYGKRDFSTALDIGCARAENSLVLFENGFKKYIGLDVDDKYFPKDNRDEIELVKASAENMPLPDQSVDFAVSFNVFEHIPEPKNAFNEILRVLKPGGVFYTKFGPPFNAASGPHLNRKINLPFLHHLFPDSEVAEFVGRENPYMTVNRKPLSYYRDIFLDGRGFSLPQYREQIDGNSLWIIKEFPHLMERFMPSELGVVSITACVVRLD